jgi:hypothetical protein
LEEGNAFAERDERHAHDLAAGARGDGVIEGGLQLHGVEEVLIVVDGAVVDGFDGGFGVSGGLAVVVDFGSGDGGSGVVSEGVVAEVAGEADEDPVRVETELGLRAG